MANQTGCLTEVASGLLLIVILITVMALGHLVMIWL